MDMVTYGALLGLIKTIPKGEDGASVTSVDFRINETTGNLEYKVEIE